MLLSAIILGLTATATASAIPESLAERIPAGVTYTVVAPYDIPEFIKTGKRVTDLPTRSVVKRQDVGVYLCTDANWGGHCVHIVSPSDVCVPLADDLNDKISSVGPDAGAYCRFYFNAGCPENSCDHFDSAQPGRADLSQSEPVCGFNPCNDQVSSYKCWS